MDDTRITAEALASMSIEELIRHAEAEHAAGVAAEAEAEQAQGRIKEAYHRVDEATKTC